MRNIKSRASIAFALALLVLFSTPKNSLAVVQILNGQTGQTQTFQNDTNVTMSSASNTHSLGWQGLLSLARGGTGANSFLAGSLIFSDGTKFTEDNSHLFWDNTNKRLGVGTSTPSAVLEVLGNAKVTSLISTNDATINGLTIGIGGGTSIYNTAVGVGALSSNTTGANNVAVGLDALSTNTVGYYNTALGFQAGGPGGDNTAVGARALSRSTTGTRNSAIGSSSLVENTSGNTNTSIGADALHYNTTGNKNVAIGADSLSSNTAGSLNVAIGQAALLFSTTGDNNIAIGFDAGRYQANGSTSLDTPNSSVYIGTSSRGYDNNDSNSIVIGANAVGAGANTTVLGNSSIADVYFGSSLANANIHAKKLYLGSSSIPGCIIMGDTASGVGYITLVSGVLTVSSTPPNACQ